MEVLMEPCDGAAQRDVFSGECLLPPDTDFMIEFSRQRDGGDRSPHVPGAARSDAGRRDPAAEDQHGRRSEETQHLRGAQENTGQRSPAGNTRDTLSAKVKTSSSSCRKALEIKPKETSAGKTGSRRVIHCKVTMQIYLMALSGRTGSAEPVPVVSSVSLRSGSSPLSGSAVETRKTVVQKSSGQKASLRDAPNHKTPIKSPSQYFQICY
ncbi:echinoderm microtubule-associated -like 1 isoform X2 [Labeo rohita]|uniref:Echinoderm microtubule-associated-like 1 isoform X2 n=1 Tax=Labeo rohita TaxID=84645 RepID=A0A498NSE1_LABRO|nr:echinoderm microtubule-associated -like 1 isoform X2 [Labeo rohita]